MQKVKIKVIRTAEHRHATDQAVDLHIFLAELRLQELLLPPELLQLLPELSKLLRLQPVHLSVPLARLTLVFLT